MRWTGISDVGRKRIRVRSCDLTCRCGWPLRRNWSCRRRGGPAAARRTCAKCHSFAASKACDSAAGVEGKGEGKQNVVHGVELDHAAVPDENVGETQKNNQGIDLHGHHLLLRQMRILLRRNNLSVFIHDPAARMTLLQAHLRPLAQQTNQTDIRFARTCSRGRDRHAGETAPCWCSR